MLLDSTQRYFGRFLYFFKKPEDILKARFIENKHQTTAAHTIYFFIDENNWCIDAIIASSLIPNGKLP